jgi:hypothetical protein
MSYTIPFEPDHECYLWCSCADCGPGRIWANEQDAEDHVVALSRGEMIEIVLVNVGQN